MAFWMRGGKFAPGYCDECPCKYPCEDDEQNDDTCPCDCEGNARNPGGNTGGGTGGETGGGGTQPTAINPIDDPVTPPSSSESSEKPKCHCTYYAVFVIECRPCPHQDHLEGSGTNLHWVTAKCPEQVCCTRIVTGIEADKLTMPDPCCNTYADGEPTTKTDCAEISREPEEGSDVVGHTDCGGTIHRVSPTFCTKAEADEWSREHPCVMPDCDGYYGFFLARMVIKGDESDPCAVDTYKCETFSAHVRGDDIIPSISIMGNNVECLSVGGGGSITDEATGNTIEIHQLSPSDLCTQEKYNEWYAEFTKDDETGKSELDRKLEEMCGGNVYPVKWTTQKMSTPSYGYSIQCGDIAGCEHSSWGCGYVKFGDDPSNWCIDAQCKDCPMDDSDESKACLSHCNFFGDLYSCAAEHKNNCLNRALQDGYINESNPSTGTSMGASGTASMGIGSQWSNASKSKITLSKPDDLPDGITGVKCCMTTTITYSNMCDGSEEQKETTKAITTLHWGDSIEIEAPRPTAHFWNEEVDRQVYEGGSTFCTWEERCDGYASTSKSVSLSVIEMLHN